MKWKLLDEIFETILRGGRLILRGMVSGISSWAVLLGIVLLHELPSSEDGRNGIFASTAFAFKLPFRFFLSFRYKYAPLNKIIQYFYHYLRKYSSSISLVGEYLCVFFVSKTYIWSWDFSAKSRCSCRFLSVSLRTKSSWTARSHDEFQPINQIWILDNHFIQAIKSKCH